MVHGSLSGIPDCELHEWMNCSRLSAWGLGLWSKAHRERFFSKAVYTARIEGKEDTVFSETLF